LNSGVTEPFITLDGGGYYSEIVRQIISRLNETWWYLSKIKREIFSVI